MLGPQRVFNSSLSSNWRRFHGKESSPVVQNLQRIENEPSVRTSVIQSSAVPLFLLFYEPSVSFSNWRIDWRSTWKDGRFPISLISIVCRHCIGNSRNPTDQLHCKTVMLEYSSRPLECVSRRNLEQERFHTRSSRERPEGRRVAHQGFNICRSKG
jgi:hypothetical protein